MPKFFIQASQMQDDKITLIGEDVKHIANVLRKQIGDEINICNIVTSENYLCQIKDINKEKIECNVIKKIQSEAAPNTEIIQKCTELGAKSFIPVEMERCVVKLDSKAQAKKIERWQKIAETAAKQSGRDAIPTVEKLINLQKVCNLIQKYDIVLLAYENEKNTTLKQVLKQIDKKQNF